MATGSWQRRLRLLGIGLLWATAFAGAATADEGITKDTIRIGTFGALSGPNAAFGGPIMDGAELVYRLVNDRGGIYGRKIVLVREDDRCDAQTGVTVAKKLIYQDDVFMIQGGVCGNPTTAAFPSIAESKIPWVVLASVADELTTPATPTIWRTALSATIESQSQVQFALDHAVKKLGIVYMNDPWGKDRMTAIHAFMKQKGMAPAQEVEIGTDANDATPQVLQLKQGGADVVLLVVYPKAGAVFVRDATKLAYKPLLVGTTTLSALDKVRDLAAVSDAAMQNVYAVNHTGFTADDPGALVWERQFKQDFPGKEWSIYPLIGIPSALVVVQALQQAGPNLTRAGFTSAMDHMQGAFTGVYAGPVTCTETEHQCNRTASIVALRDGRVVTVGQANLR